MRRAIKRGLLPAAVLRSVRSGRGPCLPRSAAVAAEGRKCTRVGASGLRVKPPGKIMFGIGNGYEFD
jgi:hypothetical protein